MDSHVCQRSHPGQAAWDCAVQPLRAQVPATSRASSDHSTHIDYRSEQATVGAATYSRWIRPMHESSASAAASVPTTFVELGLPPKAARAAGHLIVDNMLIMERDDPAPPTIVDISSFPSHQLSAMFMFHELSCGGHASPLRLCRSCSCLSGLASRPTYHRPLGTVTMS